MAKKWYDRLQGVYSSFDEFIKYDRIYGVASRLGIASDINAMQDLWIQNPMICGSTHPADFGLASAKDSATEGLFYLEGMDETIPTPVLVRTDFETIELRLFRPGLPGEKAFEITASRGVEGNWIVSMYSGENGGRTVECRLDDTMGVITLLD